MTRQPIPLTPEDVRVLTSCPLHYHFLQQQLALPKKSTPREKLDITVREAIRHLHAAGGPDRLPLQACLQKAAELPAAQKIIEPYYYRLQQDWPRMMAGNETMTLRISIAGVSLLLRGTIDRLDKTSDGGVLAILFRTGESVPPTPADLRRNPAITIYHALVAATYPLKRPVRIQELWLTPNQEVTVELSEEEYRQNLSLLREPVQALARGEVMARPGLHCDVCPFKHNGCPVYTQDSESEPDEFAPPKSGGKMTPRKWIFKI